MFPGACLVRFGPFFAGFGTFFAVFVFLGPRLGGVRRAPSVLVRFLSFLARVWPFLVLFGRGIEFKSEQVD